MLIGVEHMDTGKKHIPRGLFEKNSGSAQYVLAQFAGFGSGGTKRKVKNIIAANRFIRGLQTKAQSTSEMRILKAEALEEFTGLEKHEQVRLAHVLKWENLMKWEFDVFEVAELTDNQPLLFIGWAVLASPYSQQAMLDTVEGKDPSIPSQNAEGYRFIDIFGIPQQNLMEFLRFMELDYNHDVPYHSNVHAADVVQSLHSILVSMNGRRFAESDLELFSVLLAAVAHDVGHPGYNNGFQVKSKSDLAITYNDNSVLENYHVAAVFNRLIGINRDPRIDIFCGMKPEQIETCRKLVIQSVLETDMTKHFSFVNRIKAILISNKDVEAIEEDDAWDILHYILHMADISNAAKPTRVAEKWTDRCLEEFFRQGDEEKKLSLPVSPLCDRDTTSRADSQIGFIKFVVAPAFEILAKAIPEVHDLIRPHLEKNAEYWKSEKKKESDQ